LKEKNYDRHVNGQVKIDPYQVILKCMGTEYKKMHIKFIKCMFKGKRRRMASSNVLQSTFRDRDDV